MDTYPVNLLSSSSLRKNDVRNAAGEDLGEIKDFMIDLNNGSVVYAVLSFGGFLGIGDKLFAIPWDALHVDTDDEVFVLDVDKEQLKDAPGFDEDDWPRQPNHSFINEIYTHYGHEPYYDERGRAREREYMHQASVSRSDEGYDLEDFSMKTPDRKGY